MNQWSEGGLSAGAVQPSKGGNADRDHMREPWGPGLSDRVVTAEVGSSSVVSRPLPSNPPPPVFKEGLGQLPQVPPGDSCSPDSPVGNVAWLSAQCPLPPTSLEMWWGSHSRGGRDPGGIQAHDPPSTGSPARPLCIRSSSPVVFADTTAVNQAPVTDVSSPNVTVTAVSVLDAPHLLQLVSALTAAGLNLYQAELNLDQSIGSDHKA